MHVLQAVLTSTHAPLTACLQWSGLLFFAVSAIGAVSVVVSFLVRMNQQKPPGMCHLQSCTQLSQFQWLSQAHDRGGAASNLPDTRAVPRRGCYTWRGPPRCTPPSPWWTPAGGWRGRSRRSASALQGAARSTMRTSLAAARLLLTPELWSGSSSFFFFRRDAMLHRPHRHTSLKMLVAARLGGGPAGCNKQGS